MEGLDFKSPDPTILGLLTFFVLNILIKVKYFCYSVIQIKIFNGLNGIEQN